MMLLPKISVVIPTYNMAHFLPECLSSIIRQDYSNVEIIIVDGGSNDKTLEVVNQFSDYIHYFISEPDRGQADAVTKGLKLATGDIHHWHAADDIVMPGAFDCVAKTFCKSRETMLVISDGYAFSHFDQKLYTTARCRWINFERSVLYFGRFQSDCAYWRAEITANGLPLDTTKPLSVDEDFFLKIWLNRPHKWVSKRLGAFRVHGEQLSQRLDHSVLWENRDRTRKEVIGNLGWSETFVERRRQELWLSHLIFDRILPYSTRGISRLCRFATFDIARHNTTNWFFKQWLPPINNNLIN